LILTASFGNDADFPSIQTGLNVTWNFNVMWDSSKNHWASDGDTPTVSFDNVKLNVGQFISKFVSPIVSKIQDVIKQLEPVLDVVTARIPVISDLLGSDISLLTLAATFGDIPQSEVTAFVSFYHEVKALFGLIGTSSGGTYILLDQHYTLPIDVRTADAS